MVLAGPGRAVVARFTLKGEPINTSDTVCVLAPGSIPRIRPGANGGPPLPSAGECELMTDPDEARYYFEPTPEGSFRAEDVPPGDYQVVLHHRWMDALWRQGLEGGENRPAVRWAAAPFPPENADDPPPELHFPKEDDVPLIIGDLPLGADAPPPEEPEPAPADGVMVRWGMGDAPANPAAREWVDELTNRVAVTAAAPRRTGCDRPGGRGLAPGSSSPRGGESRAYRPNAHFRHPPHKRGSIANRESPRGTDRSPVNRVPRETDVLASLKHAGQKADG